MNVSKEESLLSELKRINGRLGELMAESGDAIKDRRRRLSDIRTDLDELHERIDAHAASNT